MNFTGKRQKTLKALGVSDGRMMMSMSTTLSSTEGSKKGKASYSGRNGHALQHHNTLSELGRPQGSLSMWLSSLGGCWKLVFSLDILSRSNVKGRGSTLTEYPRIRLAVMKCLLFQTSWRRRKMMEWIIFYWNVKNIVNTYIDRSLLENWEWKLEMFFPLFHSSLFHTDWLLTRCQSHNLDFTSHNKVSRTVFLDEICKTQVYLPLKETSICFFSKILIRFKSLWVGSSKELFQVKSSRYKLIVCSIQFIERLFLVLGLLLFPGSWVAGLLQTGGRGAAAGCTEGHPTPQQVAPFPGIYAHWGGQRYLESLPNIPRWPNSVLRPLYR